MSDWPRRVVDFWFGLNFEQWWRTDPNLDQQVRERFLPLWSDQRHLPLDPFLGDPLTALAAVILFDQFPRNMFRNHADQFSTDHLALAIAKQAVDHRLDDRLESLQRNLLYMPFEHSEDLEDQNRGVLLQAATGNALFIEAAKKHRAIIERFGRFPHRNAILGREPRPDEIAAGEVTPF